MLICVKSYGGWAPPCLLILKATDGLSIN